VGFYSAAADEVHHTPTCLLALLGLRASSSACLLSTLATHLFRFLLGDVHEDPPFPSIVKADCHVRALAMFDLNTG
jgi:hypothetical protein